MEKVLTFVRGCVTVVNYASQTIISLLANLLDLNYRIVSLLASVGSFLLDAACSIISDLFSLLICLVEDFVLFAGDLITRIDKLLGGISSGILLVNSALFVCIQDLGNALWTVISLPVDVLFLISDGIITICGLFAYVGCMVKEWLTLTYSSIILLLMVVPNACTAIWGYVITTMSTINNLLVKFLECSSSNLKHLGKLIAKGYNDLSYDTVIGILFAVLFCFTCYRLPRLLRNCRIRIAVLSVIFKVPSVVFKVLTVLRQVLNKTARPVMHCWTAITSRRTSKQVEEVYCDASTSKDCLQEQLSREIESKLCVVCQDSPKSIILLPCRHVCVCHACRMTLLQNGSTCPMCRTYVRESMHVYL